MARQVKVKKRCCKSTPRCKRCPVAMRRLERKGLAARLGKRSFRLAKHVRKKDLKRARTA